MLKPYNRAEIEFELGDEIGGEGKNSKVFKAKDVQLGADIVIKQVLKAHIGDVDRYFDESSLLYTSSHPNVVPMHYACQDSDHVYLAMPFYNNGSLKTLLKSQSITVREMIVVSTQLLSGLNNIHSKRLIHFDVKPDNILISDRGEAVLADFGLAKPTDHSGRAQQDQVYHKMAPPEAIRRHAHFTRAFDIYQVGLTMYRMCVGDETFYADYGRYMSEASFDSSAFHHDVLNGSFPDRQKYPEHIPKAMIRAISTCLEVDIENRFSSAIEIVNKMADIDDELLDWSLSASGANRTWTKNVSGHEYSLSIDKSGVSRAHKTIGTGSPRRINAGCKSRITRAEIKEFLRAH